MKKKITSVIPIIIAIFCISISSCSVFQKDSTWTFEHSASGIDSIDVTIKNGGSPSSFTLYYGQSQSVTWEGEGEDYFGGAEYTGHWTKSYVSGFHSTRYDSLKEIVFYTDF